MKLGIQALVAVVAVTVLVLFGQVHDATGTYNIALVMGASAFLIGAAAFFATGRIARSHAA